MTAGAIFQVEPYPSTRHNPHLSLICEKPFRGTFRVVNVTTSRNDHAVTATSRD
jgi:hypothetical protein